MLVVLAANSRYAIGKMTCLHSGNVEVKFGKAEMCDPDETSADEISEPCCDLQNFDLSPDSHLNKTTLKLTAPVSFTLFYSPYSLLEILNFDFVKQTYQFVTDTGPPPGTLSKLSLLSVFRI